MSTQQKWTYQKLTRRMRAAGWRSMGQGSYMYTHQNGRSVQINLFALDISGERPCEVWHAYAAANEVPAPF